MSEDPAVTPARRHALIDAGPAFAASLAHSAMMLLALPPMGQWGWSLLACLPLAWAGSRGGARARRDFAAAAAGAIPLWAVAQWWTREVSALGFVPFVLVLSMLTGLFVPALVLARRRWTRVPLTLLVPALWTGVEFFRGEVFGDGYAWGLLAHPLIDAPVIAAPAAWGGYYLVSLCVATLAGAALDVVRTPRRVAWAAGGAAVVVGVCGGAYATRSELGTRTLRLAAVQTNVPQSNKLGWTIAEEVRDFAAFAALTREAAACKPDAIVWPETMLPGMTLEPATLAQLRRAGLEYQTDGKAYAPDHFASALMALQREVGVPMIVGEEAVTKLVLTDLGNGTTDLDPVQRFNSVYTVDGGRLGGVRYDKMRLTPFGETMPYVRAWPWLRRQLQDLAASGMRLDLGAGTRPTVLTVRAAANGGEFRAATPICFEATVGSLCRRLVFDGGTRRADIMLNLTNDGWFGSSDLARLQHLQIARWRCLETATPMLRAANTGISCAIDARGAVTSALSGGLGLPPRTSGAICVDLAAGAGTTGYARVGDLAGWAAIAVGGLASAWAAIAEWRQRRTRRAAAK